MCIRDRSGGEQTRAALAAIFLDEDSYPMLDEPTNHLDVQGREPVSYTHLKRLVQFHYQGIFLEILEELGKMPLPPYIKAELENQERYQTVYSKVVGSAAAPTAGLHFTPELLDNIQEMGVKVCYVTLHVGLGTFRPVKAENIRDHEMHSEFCMISQETADIINETKRNGGRVICVGTTSCRTIEKMCIRDSSCGEIAKQVDRSQKSVDNAIQRIRRKMAR